MKAKKTSGSALLVVILITSVLSLYLASVFWVDAYMRHGVHEQIVQEKQSLLADGLADYALALYLEKKDRLEASEEVVVNPWPPDGNPPGYRGIISFNPEDTSVSISAQLYIQDRRVQTISFSIKEQADQIVICDWQRKK